MLYLYFIHEIQRTRRKSTEFRSRNLTPEARGSLPEERTTLRESRRVGTRFLQLHDHLPVCSMEDFTPMVNHPPSSPLSFSV